METTTSFDKISFHLRYNDKQRISGGDEKMEKLERRTDLTGAGFERISAGLKR